MNTIVIILIVVVIYLIHTSSPKKENFGFKDSLDSYNPRDPCNDVDTIYDCQNVYWGRMCRDKCELIKKNTEERKKNSKL